MSSGYWSLVQRTGFVVPEDRPLDELTAELTTMLGDTSAAVRDGTAWAGLSTWITRGVYDDLLPALGDGMVTGLGVGLGEAGTDTVFRRASSARVLAACLAHDNRHRLLPGDKVLEWGDRLVSWFLAEQDCRAHVEDKGQARAIAHGADAIGRLGQSSRLGAAEVAVLLDVLAERVLSTPAVPIADADTDRVAVAVLRMLRRDLVTADELETWVNRIAARAGDLSGGGTDALRAAATPQAFLRSLFVQLSLAEEPPSIRPDLLLILVDALRFTNAEALRADTLPT